jgi:CHAD domain-containing protein
LDATRNALFREKDTKNQEKELLQIVDESFETALRKFRRIEPAHPATLHRLRVVFKKFRYMVEIVHPLISNFPTEKFKDMHDYQGLLGDIHDLEIFISAFEDFAGNDTSYDPEPVSQFYKQRHSEVTNAFIEDMQHINTFWRSTPDSPFPWEVERKLESSVLPKKPSASLPVQKKDGNGKQVAAGLEA